MSKILFTSESVTEGHPDKICDQISDAILDALLAQDPMSRVACETAITTGLVLVMGEVTTTAQVDLQNIIRNTIREIGYDASEKGFDANTCGVMVALDKQSTDIAMGVDKALEAKERYEEDNVEIRGVCIEEEYNEEKDIRTTLVKIETENGARAMGRPQGSYLTLEAPNLSIPDENYHREISEEIFHRIFHKMND